MDEIYLSASRLGAGGLPFSPWCACACAWPLAMAHMAMAPPPRRSESTRDEYSDGTRSSSHLYSRMEYAPGSSLSNRRPTWPAAWCLTDPPLPTCNHPERTIFMPAKNSPDRIQSSCRGVDRGEHQAWSAESGLSIRQDNQGGFPKNQREDLPRQQNGRYLEHSTWNPVTRPTLSSLRRFKHSGPAGREFCQPSGPSMNQFAF